MKILYIHSLYSPNIVGGAEISVQILVEAMKAKGHEVAVLTTSGKDGLEIDTVNGVTVYRAQIKNIYWPYKKAERNIFQKAIWHNKDKYNSSMKKYVKEVLEIEKPDIVSCHNLSGFSISTWDVIKEYKIPIVQVLHDFYILCINSNMYKDGTSCSKRCLECKIMRSTHKRKSRQVDAVVGISKYILSKAIEEGYFYNVINRVIYNARIIDKIEIFDRKEDEMTFGFIGTLAENKGIRWLIDSFKKVENKSISLIIAGKGEDLYVGYLKELCRDDSRISFIGYTPSQEFYSIIDVLVVPSLWEEPLGMVAIEACANGIPVITTGQGGLKEIIKDGYNGLYIDNLIQEDMRNKILNIIENKLLFTKLKSNTKVSVSHFTNKNILVSRYEEVYNYALKRSK